MDTNTPPRHCPYHTAPASGDAHAGAAVAHTAPPALPPLMQPPGSWPPGPPSGLTGWGLLRSMARDMLGSLDRWRTQYGKLVHLRIWPEHQIVVTDPQLVRELLLTHHDALIRWERGVAVFSQVHGHSVLTAEGEAWRTKRHTLQPRFTPKEVAAYVPQISEASSAALQQWHDGSGDVPDHATESAITSLTMEVILHFMFSSAAGIDARSIEQAVHCVTVAGNAEFYWPASWPDSMPWKRTKRRAVATLEHLIQGQIDARLTLARAAWPDDVLSRLLSLHDDDPQAWPRQAVHDECMTAFLAGHETTAASLTWWAWCMAANPAAQASAHAEIRSVLQGRTPGAGDLPALTYLNMTLQETLRLYPAAPMLLTRRAIRPITLGGWQFPARTLFSVPMQLMQRDAAWFSDPQAFRPERFASTAASPPRGAFMPFGAGPRVCLGQHLATTEMMVMAAMLLQRFELHVPDGAAPPQQAFHITLRPAQPLRLRLVARQP